MINKIKLFIRREILSFISFYLIGFTAILFMSKFINTISSYYVIGTALSSFIGFVIGMIIGLVLYKVVDYIKYVDTKYRGNE